MGRFTLSVFRNGKPQRWFGSREWYLKKHLEVIFAGTSWNELEDLT